MSRSGSGDPLYWQQGEGNLITLESKSSLDEAMQFSVSVTSASANLPSFPSPETFTACEGAWAEMLWQLTGGLFLALGIGPYIVSGEVKTGLYALLMTNSTVRGLAEAVVTLIQEDATNVGAIMSAVVSFLVGVYNAGMLWSLVKFLLAQLGWYALFKVTAKIIVFVFLPEAEAADLLASFVIWTLNTILAGQQLGASCMNTSTVPGVYVPALT